MEGSATTDESLLQRYANGDVAAFQQLYDRFEAPLWRFVLRQCGHRARAEELTQDIWFTVTQQAPRFNDTGRFAPWLFTIARNRIIDSFRTSHHHESLEATGEHGAPALAATLVDASIESPASHTERAQARAGILRALDTLPADQREAFVLQAEGDLSLAEIAQATGANIETTKSRLRYARDKLRQSLQGYL